MEQGYKHFSHSHNLIMHQLPEGVDVSCSGCNSSGDGTVYICWQCNFFLHEQCYRATRSLKHPSHPPHPLTLVPYPTYPSNSFYCNSCEIIGTGLSYSCAHCEFDLHVQCAYSISRATSFQKAHHYPTNYYDPHHQELVPPTTAHNNVSYVSVPDNLHQHPLTASQNHYIDPNPHYVSIPNPIINEQYHSTGQNGHSVSIPTTSQYPITSSQYPSMAEAGPSVSIAADPIMSAQYPSMAQTEPSVSIPTSSQDPVISAQYPSMAQTRPSLSIPVSSQDPVASAQYPSMSQTGPSVSIPTSSQDSITGTQYPLIAQPRPSVSIPASPANHVNNTGDSSKPPSVSIPTSSQNPVTSPQYPPVDVSSVSIPTNNLNPITSDQKFNMAQNIAASVSVPGASPNYQPENHVQSGQNQSNHKGIMHFSHPHSLCMINLQDEDKEIECSGCEETLDGKGYSCAEPNCNFHLHESCFQLKQQIQHKSHPEHPLTLLPLAPYNNENGEFTCNACFSDGTGFTYHCSVCKFDLHIQCVSLPETVTRSDHEHILKLYYSCPVKGEEYTFSCDVCHVDVQKDRWTYYCESCDYGTHLGCVDCEECVADSILDTQMQLQRLQFQLEMSRQNAQLVASMGASLLSLV
ncbi:uncharacterized protein LOC111886817 [Lactuca sativa]|uniref:Zinc finger PHD-type domain-containing protein n=1 Tax=Lactuca sativa TaxID=4236 RepID=A0A9R1VWH6_LACSA|nr:uncharacterized protein LOC111886817 [Lactuca sativa]KAJ0212819.1 hypothetical protein LSAT_V11C400175190 [Lactuca sativa]